MAGLDGVDYGRRKKTEGDWGNNTWWEAHRPLAPTDNYPVIGFCPS